MIYGRKHIDLNGRTIIEQLRVVPPLRQNPVFQDEACFLHFSEGGSEVLTPTEKITIREHESVVLKCGTYFADLFQNRESGQCEVCVIHLFPDMLENIFKNEPLLNVKNKNHNRYSHSLSEKQVITHFMESLNLYFENPHLANEEILHLKIKELVVLLLHTEVAQSIEELYSYLFTPQKTKLLDVVESHIYSNINIEQIAFLSGRSLSSFKREFKKHFDDTPANFIRKKRLNRAARLLHHSSLSIREISYQVGYEDSSHFTRLFKQYFKERPSEYRKRK